MTPRADGTRNASRSFVARLSWFVLLLAASHMVLVGLAATASPMLKTTIGRYSNLPIGFRRDHIVLRFDELERVRDLDILFVGSSHSLRTFDPRYFERHGIHAFNLGTANQTPINTYYLLQRYVPELRPRLVVLEVWWETLAIDAIEGTIAITVNRGPGWDTLKMGVTTGHPMALHAQWSSLIERALGSTTAVQLDPADVYTSGGYLERWDVNSAAEVPREGRDLALNEQQMRYLSRTLALLRDHDVLAIMVWAPVTTARLHTTANLEQIRHRLAALSKEHDAPFVDLNGRVPLDDRLDFKDDHHLNQRGVDKVMPVFLDDLREFHLLGEETGRLEISR